MIQQRIGDLLEIEEGGQYFYVVVLSKVIMFGGNILFAFHNEGQDGRSAALRQTAAASTYVLICSCRSGKIVLPDCIVTRMYRRSGEASTPRRPMSIDSG